MSTVNDWNYLVHWEKAFQNLREIEIILHLMNFLIGKDNIEEEFRLLAEKYPEIIKVLPIIVAYRNTKFTLLTNFDNDNFNFKDYDFKRLSVDEAIEFATGSGLFSLMRNKKITNMVDYVLGIEIGLDSNARKNRSGRAMEKLVESHIRTMCSLLKLEYLSQADCKEVKNKWNTELATDKTDRKIDFVIRNEDVLYLIETNFYSGTGSKLKSTAGEYKAIFDFWSQAGHKFIWITDGFGWKGCSRPLMETYEHIDFLLNIKMLYNGILTYIVRNKL